jgi:hypothetical protein
MQRSRFHFTLLATALVATAIAITVPNALAQYTTFQAEIPFTFHAGDRSLPAGSYQIRVVAPNVVRVTNLATNDIVTVMTSSVINRKDEGLSRILFNRYGAEYFLSEMYWRGYEAGLAPIKSKLEIELAKNTEPFRIVARARAK